MTHLVEIELAHPSRRPEGRPFARRFLVVPGGGGPTLRTDVDVPYLEYRYEVIDRSFCIGSPEWNDGSDTTCFYGSTPTRAFERALHFVHDGDVPDHLPEVVVPADVIACGASPNVALCDDCIDAYRNGIEPGATACEDRAA